MNFPENVHEVKFQHLSWSTLLRYASVMLHGCWYKHDNIGNLHRQYILSVVHKVHLINPLRKEAELVFLA